ncbi:holo-ACP synthase [Clostridium sp. NSJ-6]|uniref:Holo-[acyl-carrier-protein] synthase n=1 Tax=Clostridium hominis TaxID=2763036 RepID=A0ABR7DG00_9CLOT|nr:holo-ACP synthase [Clostridium hominis]MBC5630355.1 holo-ACP synthase [Clostridium hominis]MDU2673242.1 holo-ACP synthase [Clostridium sp.]
MILGVGTDIIEIERIKKAIERTPKFLEKTFTGKEIELFKSKAMKAESIAGNFAAKEAISKAIGRGFRGFAFNDLEVLRDELGKPIVNISDKVKEFLEYEEVIFHISISHNKTCAIAFVTMEVR